MVAESSGLANDDPRGVGRTRVVALSDRGLAVHAALTRLCAGGFVWSGTVSEVAAAAQYSERSTSTALNELEAAGVIQRARASGVGKPSTYMLSLPASDDAQILLRERHAGSRKPGREVVRSAAGASHTAPRATIAASSNDGFADGNRQQQPTAMPSNHPLAEPFSSGPSLSSESSSSDVAAAADGDAAAADGPEHPEQALLDAIAVRLSSMGIEALPSLVERIAALSPAPCGHVGYHESPRSDLWDRLVKWPPRRPHRYHTPNFVAACLDTIESQHSPGYVGMPRRATSTVTVPQADALASTVSAALVVGVAAGRWAWGRVHGLRRGR